MAENNRGRERGINIGILAIEQKIEIMNDETLLKRVKKLDRKTRRIISAAWGLSGLDRDSFLELATTSEPKSDAEELVHQQILNYMSLKPEILDRLNSAVSQIDEPDNKNNY